MIQTLAIAFYRVLSYEAFERRGVGSTVKGFGSVSAVKCTVLCELTSYNAASVAVNSNPRFEDIGGPHLDVYRWTGVEKISRRGDELASSMVA